MSGLNKVQVIGNLTRDPETTYLQSGTACTKISVATSEEWKDKTTGEKKEETEFHRIVFWGNQADVVGKHFFKGKQIYVEGRLKTSKYTKDGIDKYSTDIIASKFLFIGSKSDNQSSGQQGQPQNAGNGFQTPQQQSGGQQPTAGGYQQQPRNQEQDQDLPF